VRLDVSADLLELYGVKELIGIPLFYLGQASKPGL